MNRDFRTDSGMPTDDSPPSEAWLFGQAILGRPIPRIVSPQARAQAKREELTRLAEYSSRHADELRQLEAAEAQARQERESLEWAAQICDEATGKLRAIERKEAEEREAWRRAEQYAATLLEGTSEARQSQAGSQQRDESSLSMIVEWDPDQPRQPKGTPQGGQWAPKDGGGKATSSVDSKTGIKIWKGQYGRAAASKSTVTFKVRGNGVALTGRDEQAIADAVLDAVDRFSDVADIIKNSRSRLKAHFTNPNLLVGKMAHDDSIYRAVGDNMGRVVKGIKDGELVLDGDPKYTSGNEPLLYTNMNPLTYNARGEMRFTGRFVNASHEEKVRALLHEFGRRWGRQYENGADPKWGVGAWDETIDRIYSQRGAIRGAK
jgi:hypothetical protein